jgi:ArsR family transcriptional regulator
MFKAFADETRLRILHLLTRGELCVCDIHDTLKLPQTRVSRHLAYLRAASLVRVRKEGLWKHYSLAPAQGKFQKSLIRCLKGCFDEVDVLQRDLAALKQKKRC